ncbi:IS3 family transposase [Streptomyces sp. NPDC054770]
MIRFIDAHRGRFGVEPICRTPTVASSTYYAARRRPPAVRSPRDAELTAEIRRVHQANYGVYGVRKVWHQLRR